MQSHSVNDKNTRAIFIIIVIADGQRSLICWRNVRCSMVRIDVVLFLCLISFFIPNIYELSKLVHQISKDVVCMVSNILFKLPSFSILQRHFEIPNSKYLPHLLSSFDNGDTVVSRIHFASWMQSRWFRYSQQIKRNT